MLFRRTVFCILGAVLLAGVGCGGSEDNDYTCSDACNHMFDCAAKLAVSPSDFLGPDYVSISSCVDRCATGDCPKIQDLINCSMAVPCYNITQVIADVANCFTDTGCVP